MVYIYVFYSIHTYIIYTQYNVYMIYNMIYMSLFDLRRLHAGRFGQGRRRSAKSVKRSTNTEPWMWRWWTLNQTWWSLNQLKMGI